MGTSVKSEFIKIRVSKEQKELFKRVAELKGITMTDLLVVGTEQRALQDLDKATERESLEPRVETLERKLELTKARLEERRKLSKKFFK